VIKLYFERNNELLPGAFRAILRRVILCLNVILITHVVIYIILEMNFLLFVKIYKIEKKCSLNKIWDSQKFIIYDKSIRDFG